jgi:hypothetical protein
MNKRELDRRTAKKGLLICLAILLLLLLSLWVFNRSTPDPSTLKEVGYGFFR